MYNEIKGDLIELAKQGVFDLIAHGCNCHCIQEKGLALQMKNTFSTHIFPLEGYAFKGDINKLGSIDYQQLGLNQKDSPDNCWLTVINCYTQYRIGKNLDYDALRLCLKKINHIFKGKHIGLPLIGCGIAGGDWNIVKDIIQKELTNMKVTIVIL